MKATERTILTEQQVRQAIRRIAFEVYENNFNEKKIAVVGICDNGYAIAQLLVKELVEIVDGIAVELVRLRIDKTNPSGSEIALDAPAKQLSKKATVLVDDVLNTGKTVAYSLKALLEVEVKKLHIAVLVDRSHKLFPISANFKGYELSTTIDEHVEVRLGENPGIFLY